MYRFENYRPISVLTCFSKMLEKLIAKRLKKFIDKNNILSKHHYGFMHQTSLSLMAQNITMDYTSY